MPLAVSLNNEQKIPITIAPKTPGGNPAPIDGPVQASVISGEATIEPINSTSFYLVSGANPGDSTVLVEADADLGNGVVLIQDTVVATVTGAMAANLGVSAGTPVPK